jgi:putative DNA primase/helicase
MNISEFIEKVKATTGHEPKKSGPNVMCRCPGHDDRVPSLSVSQEDDGKLLLHCFAGCSAAEIVGALGLELKDLMPPTNGNGHPVSKATRSKKKHATREDAIAAALWSARQVDPDATLGQVWDYQTFDGTTAATVAAVARINLPTPPVEKQRKVFRPVHREAAGWATGDPAGLWPLYRLPCVAQAETVNVTEGERCADALAAIGYAATTSAHGAAAAGKTDWQPVARKITVYLWPDNDEPGESYIADVARILIPMGCRVRVVRLPDLPEHGDICDWLASRPAAEAPEQTKAVLDALIAAAPEYTPPQAEAPPQTKAAAAAPQSAADKRREQKAAEMAALMIGVELWHDAEGDAFATIETNGHRESWPVSSKTFARFIKGRAYAATQTAMSDDTWQDIKSALEAEAIVKGQQAETAIRICRTADAIYLDLADANWRAVRVTAGGWSVVSAADCPVKFLRKRGMLPLPEPVVGGCISDLRHLINVPDDADWILLIAWLLAALKPDMPQMILALTGEQGSAKSTACRILRGIIDANKCPVRRPPKNESDLFIAANAGLIVSLDNLSSLQPWLSDAMCSLATGGGIAKRQLYTDGDEFIIDARRPILLNGIEDVATRPDLMDRSIMVHLPTIPDVNRRDEKEIYSAFEQARPHILGALLTAVSTGLRNLPDVRLNCLPRTADFAKWVTACEPALPWPPGSFTAAYMANRATGNIAATDASPVATAIRELAQRYTEHPWQGSYKDLLLALEGIADEKAIKSKGWPSSARGLSGAIERCRPNLRAIGITIEDLPADPGTRRHCCRITRI